MAGGFGIRGLNKMKKQIKSPRAASRVISNRDFHDFIMSVSDCIGTGWEGTVEKK